MLAAVPAILNGAAIPPRVNNTYVALIPKKPRPVDMGDLSQSTFVTLFTKCVNSII